MFSILNSNSSYLLHMRKLQEQVKKAFCFNKFCKFSAFSLKFAKILRSLEQFVQTVKCQDNFWQQNAFLTCSWSFLRSKKVEKFKFKLEKIIGIQKSAGKVRKYFFLYQKKLSKSFPLFWKRFIMYQQVPWTILKILNTLKNWKNKAFSCHRMDKNSHQ